MKSLICSKCKGTYILTVNIKRDRLCLACFVHEHPEGATYLARNLVKLVELNAIVAGIDASSKGKHV